MDILYYVREGLSHRAIARKLRMHAPYRQEVRGASRTHWQGAREPASLQQDRRLSRADCCLPGGDPQYQASTIYERLCRKGFTGGYGIVKRAVRPIRQANNEGLHRFETEPGAQAQMDFGEFQVQNPDGTIRKYYLFAMILGYSRMLYAELLERCDMVSFLDAHNRGFCALGGVPREVLYDRMRNVFLRTLGWQGPVYSVAGGGGDPLRFHASGSARLCSLGQGQDRTAHGLRARKLLARL